jgi:putative NADPH-quinone reductase
MLSIGPLVGRSTPGEPGAMNVLWLFAHPDPHSLGGALRDEGLATLRALGHDVRESDLYAMGWNPVVDEIAVTPPDVAAEQAKLAWADAVVVQFPLWWYGMPAILKGWFDRVFVKGYAYDVRGADGRTLRYGDGALSGKRALVVVTTGSPAPALGPRGVNGPLADLLFGLHHGTLFYASPLRRVRRRPHDRLRLPVRGGRPAGPSASVGDDGAASVPHAERRRLRSGPRAPRRRRPGPRRPDRAPVRLVSAGAG